LPATFRGLKKRELATQFAAQCVTGGGWPSSAERRMPKGGELIQLGLEPIETLQHPGATAGSVLFKLPV